MQSRLFVLQFGLLLVSSFAVLAQALPASPEQDQVTVSVFITDAHGNPLTTINNDDLSIADNHKPPAKVIGINHDNSPLRLGVLIDQSNSQRQSALYKPAVEGVSEFVRQALRRNVDRVFVGSFGTPPDQTTPWMSADEFATAKFHLQPSGGTALYDAIVGACKDRFAGDMSPARRVLVLLSDGEDNTSHLDREAAIEAAQRSKVAVIAINTGNSYEHRGVSVLKDIVENTGGYTFVDPGEKGMQQVFSQIANQLDSMFQVVYVPGPSPNARQSHQLQIKPESGKKLRVEAPKRYYTMNP